MKGMLALFLILFSAQLYAAEIEITDECVHLNELLGDAYPAAPVLCGFYPGDKKIVQPAAVNGALKRLGLRSSQELTGWVVSRSGLMLDEARISDEIIKAYKNAHPEKQIQLESVRIPKPIYLAGIDSEYTMYFDTAKAGSCQAYVTADGKRHNFTYTVKLFEEGYVATDRIMKGEGFAGKVTKELIDVTNLRNALVTDYSDVVASRGLVKGKVLTTDLVEGRPERMKGDVIQLSYISGDIKIEIAVVAEQNAVPGKTFLVKNPSTDKVFSALYVGNGKAVVN